MQPILIIILSQRVFHHLNVFFSSQCVFHHINVLSSSQCVFHHRNVFFIISTDTSYTRDILSFSSGPYRPLFISSKNAIINKILLLFKTSILLFFTVRKKEKNNSSVKASRVSTPADPCCLGEPHEFFDRPCYCDSFLNLFFASKPHALQLPYLTFFYFGEWKDFLFSLLWWCLLLPYVLGTKQYALYWYWSHETRTSRYQHLLQSGTVTSSASSTTSWTNTTTLT